VHRLLDRFERRRPGRLLLSFLPNPTSTGLSNIGQRRQKVVAALCRKNCLRQCREAAFKQAVRSQGRTHRRLRKYGADRATAVRTVAQALGRPTHC